jgi:hypothetical protein
MVKRTFSTKMLSGYLHENGVGAMDLVRLAGIAVSTAYKITKGQDLYDLNVFYNVYLGLKNAGYEISWTQVVELD